MFKWIFKSIDPSFRMKVFFLCLFFGLVLGASENEHSLYYQYTAQSKLYRDDLFECTAVTVLDGRQIDSYNIRDGLRTPKQDWLTKLPRTDWNRGTAELNDYGHWLNKRLHLVIEDFKHKISDVHVLQWMFGCETEASFKVLSCINEFGYDGEDLISYNWTSKQWKASVWQAKNRAEKWNYQHGPNAVFVTCVELIKIYVNYSNTEIRQSPLVNAFAKRAVNNPGKLTLTCMATGFYPKDVKMSVRKYRTSLPEHLITSSGVRPNEDDTYQLRKSLDILENDDADYDCYVTHSSLKEPVINKWDGKCNDCSDENVLSGVIGGVVGALALLAVVGAITYCVIKKRNVHSDTDASNGSCNCTEYIKVAVENGSNGVQHDRQVVHQ